MNLHRPWVIAVTCLLLMAATAAMLTRLQSHQHLGQPGLRLSSLALTNELGEVATTNSIHLPANPLDYVSELRAISREELDWLPADTTYGRRYYRASDGFEALVSAVLMGTDRTSIHKPEYCLPGQGFQITRKSARDIRIDRPHPYRLPVMRLDALREIRSPDGPPVRLGAVYVYWFLSDTRLSNDHLQRMWWLAFDLVRTGELQRWAYLGCLAICHPGQEDAAYARLEALIQAIVPEVHEHSGPAVAASSAAPGRLMLPPQPETPGPKNLAQSQR